MTSTPHIPSIVPSAPASGFQDLGISAQILGVLKRMHIETPTPIQRQSIPIGIEGKDIMGIAQTGTGKTLAFGIPLVERLDHLRGKGLVVLPTRELAQQANETLQAIGRVFGLHTAVLIGGESMYRQREALRRAPQIIVATPGRLIDHLEQGTVNLGDVKVLVLDEADRMLDMGFLPQLTRILSVVPKNRQTLLFSATMPSTIVKLATSYMALPVRIEVAPAGTTASDIEQEIFIVPAERKLSLLERLLQEYSGTVLVFSRTKHGAKKITRILRTLGHSAAEIHANRSQSQRREALSGFKGGRYRVLVATDIAARGIDVTGIEVVINFDLPDNSGDYVHRIGRTGRAGQKGRAISFAAPNQRSEIREIEKLIRKPLVISKTPELPPSNYPAPSAADREEDRRGPPRRNSRYGRPQGPGREPRSPGATARPSSPRRSFSSGHRGRP